MNGQPIVIPIKNPSFEQTTNPLVPFSNCESRAPYDNPGWNFAYGSEIIKSCLAPPSGSNVALIQNSTISQDTGVKPSDLQQPGVGANIGLYVMKFWVANYFTVYPGYYEADIYFGQNELCSIDGWATQNFSEITLMGLSPDYLLGQWPDGSAVDPNAHIIILLSNAKGWPLLFDNVSLTFTPTN